MLSRTLQTPQAPRFIFDLTMTTRQMTPSVNAASAGQFSVGGDMPINRLGFGAMRLTGRGIWGPPADRDAALAVLRRASELGVNLIDTADSYGPDVSEELTQRLCSPTVAIS